MGLTQLGLSLSLGHRARQKGLIKSSTSFQNYLLQPDLDNCETHVECLEKLRGAPVPIVSASHRICQGRGPGVRISVSQVMLRCIQKASHPLMRVLLEGDEPTASATVLFPRDQKSER